MYKGCLYWTAWTILWEVIVFCPNLYKDVNVMRSKSMTSHDSQGRTINGHMTCTTVPSGLRWYSSLYRIASLRHSRICFVRRFRLQILHDCDHWSVSIIHIGVSQRDKHQYLNHFRLLQHKYWSKKSKPNYSLTHSVYKQLLLFNFRFLLITFFISVLFEIICCIYL